jgi:ABC-type lipoprotein export system ATPase subunit
MTMKTTSPTTPNPNPNVTWGESATDLALVRCVGVGRTYGSGRAAVLGLHDATCAVFPDEQLALVGPSGSGKSTLLHLLAGLDIPTAGTISWPALGAREALRPGPVGVVFQGPSLLPPLDVTENVALPLLLAGIDREAATAGARDALARLGLGELGAKLPEELSGGQAQRVAVARVLAGAPRLILADEPTGQLDHVAGAQVIEVLIEAATATGAALVVSTHDEELAARMAERWQMSDGRLHVTTETPTQDPMKEPACSA